MQFAGRLKDADDVLQRASQRKLEIPDLLFTEYDIAFLKGDKAGMERLVARAKGNPDAEEFIALREGFVLAYSGHLQQARKKARHAAEVAQQAGQRGRSALIEPAAALWEGFLGNAPEARQGALAALELSKDRDAEYGAAFALALAGDSRSQTLASDLERRFPEDCSVRFGYVPGLRALALKAHEPAKAIELLKIGVPL